MSDNAQLLPCPFCGSPARICPWPHAGGHGWVQCSECECEQDMSDTLEEAVKRWNTRTALSQGGSSDQKWQAVRDTVADEWGSHVCYADSFGVRSCGKNNPDLNCRCADIAKAVVSVHGINAQVERPWMPIKTAPRDGTPILAVGGGLASEAAVVTYNKVVGCWNAPNDTLDDRDDDAEGYNRPTYWQRIPAFIKGER